LPISEPRAGASARPSPNSCRVKRCRASVSQYTSNENCTSARKRSSLSRTARSARRRPALNSLSRKHNATKIANGSRCSGATANEFTGGKNQYCVPTMQTTAATKPGPRPPYQAVSTTAASGRW
jgi:hypothetical protein